jgi:3-hydroxyisobutyrate dehydrogenase-like beta-hydroxyacid dehydrogenase
VAVTNSKTRTNQQSIAFLGFGEVGRRFAADLAARDDMVLSAFDVAGAQDPRRGVMMEAAGRCGVRLAPSAADAGAQATYVISAVTADQSEAVARQAAGWLRPGQVFIDVNSASPATKQRAAAHVAAPGADYVECAVMAPVLGPGLRVPMLIGGPAAQRTADALNALGFAMTPVAETFGRASAIKLCRSIVIKGLEALMVDCAAATSAFQVERDVYASLGATYPSIDWAALAADMGERVATHGVRRAAEMREAAAMLADAGLVPDLAAAVADAQARGAKKSR